MKTKNMAITLLLVFFITSFQPCYSMDYVRSSYNSVSTKINHFVIRCREVGVLATIYAAFGVYDFKKITGLDEHRLDEYSAQELQEAAKRIDVMCNPSNYDENRKPLTEKCAEKLLKFSARIN